ncbi:hypothetical protein BD779DRAFT_1556237 [Infundibulicybe gibba]|nr:hypothetical protein BD779DRAFT_1556237 [Infundibulicybe gibba]
MSSVSNALPSTVNFPTSDPTPKPVIHARPPHLPFRRISLPTAPSLMHRESVVSVASFDSLPEEEGVPVTPLSSSPRSAHPPRKARGRMSSNDSPRKNRRREGRPVDNAREAKRRKLVDEFYDTERTYVDGLELIYSHFLTPIIASLDDASPLLDRGAITSIFSNFIDIWNFHRSFFGSLSSLLSKSSSTSTPEHNTPPLSPILLSHFPYLSLYTPFITSFSVTPDFAAFLVTQEADARCGRLKLRDWLLTIVQRCPRYLLLLKDLIDCTDPDDPEHGQLMAVHVLVSKITLSLNTSLHTHAQTLALLALQRSTPNLPFQLIIPGRTLLRRGPCFNSNAALNRGSVNFSCEDADRAWGIGLGGWGGGSNVGESPSPVSRPPMARTRSKSEAELHMLKAMMRSFWSIWPATAKKSYHPPSSAIKRNPSTGAEDRWVYKGRAELVDLEVIVAPHMELGDERRFEILSPEGSFVLYAGNEQERDEWSSAIRQAKSQLLISLNVTHPHSTLTSSSSTSHIRRSLQALPFPPSDDRNATYRESTNNGRGKMKRAAEPGERRGKVEHWVPAIWIPDEKTEGCMRCGKSFGWRRRRHHCRLCGRCVCAGCSGRTFFISDPNSKDASKPARACDACYEAVFPLLDPPEMQAGMSRFNSDTITSLSNFPSWLSMPTLPVSPTPQALMAIDRERGGREYSEEQHDHSGEKKERIRMRTQSRPKSYHQILEEFEHQQHGRHDLDSPLEEGDAELELEQGDVVDGDATLSPSQISANLPQPRKEDTARRSKRFSLPAIAVQTTSVTARTNDTSGANVDPAAPAARSKRFSLVLGSRSHHRRPGSPGEIAKVEKHNSSEGGPLGRGVAAGKLSELLGRKKE